MSYSKLLLTILTVTTVSTAQPPTLGNCTIFPSDNIWNTPVDTLPVSSKSTNYVKMIGRTAYMHADFGSGLWAGGPIGIPFVRVPGTQTKYTATFQYSDESDRGPYAVPLNAPIEGGPNSSGDRHAIAIDTDTCVLYELYAAYPQSGSWQAGSGAIFNLRVNGPLRPAGWTSGDAAGLPIQPGLVRYDEVASGEIRHALRFTVPRTQKAFVWPARHYASSITDPAYPPMGQRFRLRASFDISGFPAQVQVILRALKKYGMMVADNGSAWYLSGEPDPRWNNDALRSLHNITGDAFEAVDVSSVMIDQNSGQARQSGSAVTISPATATLVVLDTQQFTASQTVTWAVNGIPGGNSQVGYISTTGLYSAPSTVPNPATIAVQGGGASASVTIRNPAPVITSVSPNSIPAGSFTLTVNGNGFQPGSVVLLNETALSTTVNSSVRLTATGSTSSGGSVAVRNPDGQISNAMNLAVATPISVTVSPTTASVRVGRAIKFTATVMNSSDQRVTWKVNFGTISNSGRYTAPSDIPPTNPVTVTATSVADPARSGAAIVSVRR